MSRESPYSRRRTRPLNIVFPKKQITFPPIDVDLNELRVYRQVVLSETRRSATGGLYTVPANYIYVIDSVFMQTSFEGNLAAVMQNTMRVIDPPLLFTVGFICANFGSNADPSMAISQPVSLTFPTGYIVPSSCHVWIQTVATWFTDYTVHGYLCYPSKEITTFWNQNTW